MHKRSIAMFAVLGVVGLMAWMAVAANIHFVDGITCADQGTTLQVCGKVAGLGNQPLKLTVTADATIVATCTNNGGKTAPGQNKVTKRATGTVTISPSQFDKNGNVTFCLSTASLSVTAKEAGCPNNNWDANPTDVEFTNVFVTATQGTQKVGATCS